MVRLKRNSACCRVVCAYNICRIEISFSSYFSVHKRLEGNVISGALYADRTQLYFAECQLVGIGIVCADEI